jgi:hypothetical protein
MGNRANLVIVEHGDWTLHYSHWAGCRSRFEAACAQVQAVYTQTA